MNNQQNLPSAQTEITPASLLATRVREITADPEHYPQTSRNAAENNAVWILGHAAKLSTEWQRLNANVTKGDPDLFWVAETLAFWDLAEARKEPHHYESRRDWHTDEIKQIGIGCICFFRLKPEALAGASACLTKEGA